MNYELGIMNKRKKNRKNRGGFSGAFFFFSYKLQAISYKRPIFVGQKSGGFALLFAILASSVLLSISLSIFSIASREILFSSFGRESQQAFFAADVGVECALYWDFRSNAFSTSTPSAITCAGQTPALSHSVDGSGNGTTTTTTNLPLGADASAPCVVIEVGKAYSGTTLLTNVRSYGHNTCDSGSPLLLERALRVHY